MGCGADAVDEGAEVCEPLSPRLGSAVGVEGAIGGGPGLSGVGHEGEVVHDVCAAEGDVVVCFPWKFASDRKLKFLPIGVLFQ